MGAHPAGARSKPIPRDRMRAVRQARRLTLKTVPVAAAGVRAPILCVVQVARAAVPRRDLA